MHTLWACYNFQFSLIRFVLSLNSPGFVIWQLFSDHIVLHLFNVTSQLFVNSNFTIINKPPDIRNSLTQELIDELKNVIAEPQQGPKRFRLLSSAILREITPTSQLVITNLEPPVEQKNIPIILPLVWVQVSFVVSISWLSNSCSSVMLLEWSNYKPASHVSPHVSHSC